MAVVTISGTHTVVAKGVVLSRWNFATALAPTSGSIGNVLGAPNYPDKTVISRGNASWGTGVTVIIQGSNTVTYTTGTAAWFTLHSASGADLSMSTGKARTILENPRWIRPRLSTRTGTLGSALIEITSQSTRR